MPDPQGGPVRPPFVEPIKKSSFRLLVLIGIQIILSVTVLSICLGLLATLPVGASSPSPISLAIFVTIFSILSWIHILLIADHLKDKLGRNSSIVIGILTLIFYLISTLVLTVAIAPAQSCSNDDYVQKNKLLAGVGGSRCRLIQANIALFWVGTVPILDFLIVAFGTYVVCAVLKLKREWKKDEDAIYGDEYMED